MKSDGYLVIVVCDAEASKSPAAGRAVARDIGFSQTLWSQLCSTSSCCRPANAPLLEIGIEELCKYSTLFSIRISI